jgi:hypothetical protein
MFYAANTFIVLETGVEKLPIDLFKRWIGGLGQNNRRWIKSLFLQTMWVSTRSDGIPIRFDIMTRQYCNSWTKWLRSLMSLARVDEGGILERRRSEQDEIYHFIILDPSLGLDGV